MLVQKINRATDSFVTAYYDFMDSVYTARDARKQRRRLDPQEAMVMPE